MAFQKSILNVQTGVIARYWRIASISLDALNGRATIVLAGYVSVEIRGQSDGIPVDQRVFQIDQPAFVAMASAAASAPTVFGVIATAAYGHVRAAQRMTQNGMQPSEFADAEDV